MICKRSHRHQNHLEARVLRGRYHGDDVTLSLGFVKKRGIEGDGNRYENGPPDIYPYTVDHMDLLATVTRHLGTGRVVEMFAIFWGIVSIYIEML